MPMPVQRDMVDGVVTFRGDWDLANTMATLLFGFGYADETLPESGWQHFVEHSAMAPQSARRDAGVNAWVAPQETGFTVFGAPDEVRSFLTELGEWLCRPQWDRWHTEISVLRAEDEQEGDNFLARLLCRHFGLRGPGLRRVPTVGLSRATPDLLSDRIRRTLTRGNAVLTICGPEPVGLRLPLPEGPPVPSRPLPPLNPPGQFHVAPQFSLSAIVDRSGPWWMAHRAVAAALTDRLRQRSGGSYAPFSDYVRVSAESALLYFGADATSEYSPHVVDHALEVIDRIAEQGPSTADLTRVAKEVERGLDGRERMIADLTAHATAELGNGRYRSPEQIIEGARAVTPDEVAVAMRAFRDAMIVGVPAGTPLDEQGRVAGRFVSNEQQPVPRSTVRGVRHLDWPLVTERLLVDEGGMEVQSGEVALRVDLDELVGVLGTRDGERVLMQGDGGLLMVDSRHWHGGDVHIRRLDELVPEGLKLAPHRPWGDPYRRRAWPVRWSVGIVRRRWFRVLALVLAALVGVVAMIGWIVVPGVPGGGLIGMAGAAITGISIRLLRSVLRAE